MVNSKGEGPRDLQVDVGFSNADHGRPRNPQRGPSPLGIDHLEIIGEASKARGDEARDALPQVPWTEMIRLRDRLSHH